MFLKICVLTLVPLLSYAQVISELSYIDIFQKKISDVVVNSSQSIDSSLGDLFQKQDTDIRTKNERAQYSVDAFFQNKKFLEDTDEVYVRIRSKAHLQTKYSEKFSMSTRAHIPLRKTRKNIKLFIKNFNKDTSDTSVLKKEDFTNNEPTIGLSYLRPKSYGIESKYSLGFRNIHPYIRARYKKEFLLNDWLIQPVQSFRYSHKYSFEEETNIYFDKKVNKNSLLRFQLLRATHSSEDGIDYGFSSSYFHTLDSHTAVSISQSFYGNTKYRYILNESIEPNLESDKFGGINNYVTQFNFRQNVWKKWFYYEINPSINFPREKDYKANYSLLVNLDFYFGKLH